MLTTQRKPIGAGERSPCRCVFNQNSAVLPKTLARISAVCAHSCCQLPAGNVAILFASAVPFKGINAMQRLTLALLFVSIAGTAAAESRNPADYPLRVHIFRRSETTFYHNRQTEEAKGEGRANLFEGGEPKGIDFQFECDTKLQTSSGYETFPAKWKKPGQELVILEPQFGKAGYDTCHLKVMVKDFAYVTHSGNLTTEPVGTFKQWMVRHQYDPEQGKNAPIRLAADAAPVGSGATPAAPPATPAPATPPQ